LVSVNGRAVTLGDEETGASFEVSPKLLINAAGPWIDQANRILGLSTHYIGGTKGSHLVLDNPELRQAIGRNEFFFENKDGRIVLIFPFSDKVIVGTSDLPIDDPDMVRCTPEEEDYFLEMTARVFPDIKVTREQIVFRFCGVRPLAYTQARNAGQITRDHHVQEDRLGELTVYSLVGGKWTSFRAFSEMVTDKALAFLGRERKAGTQALPIGGGRDYPATGLAQVQYLKQVGEQTGLADTWPKILFDRYGTRAGEIGAYMTAGKDSPLKSRPDMTTREIAFLADKEKIVHLDDLLLRRTMLAYLGELDRPTVDELAGALGQALGWPKKRVQDEVARALAILADRHGIAL